ncbi:MAG: glycosyltransferase family 4 protein [Deltaproteobacteria bacterium]|nr:glycosyltransferase family 4 protein [Deltaproteobacteria bacterium]
MKVLMLGWEFPPFISGGLGTVCHALTHVLTELGTEVLFVLPKVYGEKEHHDKLELLGANEVLLTKKTRRFKKNVSEKTLTVLEVDSFLEPYQTELSYDQKVTKYTEKLDVLKELQEDITLGRFEFSGGYGKNLIHEVARYALIGVVLARNEAFDVIHAHDWMTFPAAVEAKKISGKPLICHVHATEFDRTGDNPNHEIARIEKYGLEEADRIIAVSQRTKDALIHKYGIDEKKIFVVYNAVSKEKQIEREHIKRNLKEKIVLFMGRITLQKGPDYFVEAARLVLEKMDNVRFVMAGVGDMFNRLVERVAQCRMQKNFHFTGFLHGREVEEMFAMSDIYVMPSVSEPFGLTPFEAMLYHVPAIISKQSGVAEVFENAVKVDFWDIQKLADSIIDILTDKEKAERMVREGGKELDKISWNLAGKKIIDHYHQMVGS